MNYPAACCGVVHANARLEGLNGVFQAARARASGYRYVFAFMTMNDFIAAPLSERIKFNSNDEEPQIYERL